MGIEVIGGGSAGGKGRKVDFFDSSGTWTCPDDVTQIEVIMGGGGGGGRVLSSNNDFQGATGGFGSCERKFLNVTPGTTYAITIGAGGIGGSSNANFSNSSTQGGSSSFSNLLTVPGGQPGYTVNLATNSLKASMPYDLSSLTSLGGHPGKGPFNYNNNIGLSENPNSGYLGRSGAGGSGPGLPTDGGGYGVGDTARMNGKSGSGAGGGGYRSNTNQNDQVRGDGGSGYCEIIYWTVG